MSGESLTFLVTGEEGLADALALACLENLDCAPPFVAWRGQDPPEWRLIVRLNPPPPQAAPNWSDVVGALVTAMSSYDMTMDYPLEREMRQRLDNLFDQGRRLLAAHPGAAVLVVAPGGKPVPLAKAKGVDMAWRLLE